MEFDVPARRLLLDDDHARIHRRRCRGNRERRGPARLRNAWLVSRGRSRRELCGRGLHRDLPHERSSDHEKKERDPGKDHRAKTSGGWWHWFAKFRCGRFSKFRCRHFDFARSILDLCDLTRALLESIPRELQEPSLHLRRARYAHRCFERERHLSCVRKTPRRIAFQGPHDHGIYCLVDSGANRARTLDRQVPDVAHGRRLRLASEELSTSERFPKHDAGGEDVGATIDAFSAELLRRHVGELPFEATVLGRLKPSDGLGDSEVEHAGDAVGADQNVLRRDVAVHEVERLASFRRRFVRSVEPVQRAAHDRRNDRRRDGEPFADRALQKPRERLAGHVLHDQEELAAGEYDVIRRDDVGVTDTRGEVRFVEEALVELGIEGDVRMQALDRDRPFEPSPPEHPPEMHGRHPPRCDGAVEGIAPETKNRAHRAVGYQSAFGGASRSPLP